MSAHDRMATWEESDLGLSIWAFQSHRVVGVSPDSVLGQRVIWKYFLISIHLSYCYLFYISIKWKE